MINNLTHTQNYIQQNTIRKLTTFDKPTSQANKTPKENSFATALAQVENKKVPDSKNINNSFTTQSANTNNNFRSFIKTATSEELDNKLKSIKQSKAPTAMFNLNNVMSSENSFELAGRINHSIEQFKPEAEIFHQQQLELIKKGEAEDKTSKDILSNIAKLYDEQSDLFKASMHWGDKGLSAYA